ncbi:MAG: ATP-binding cassette domain-containing protein [Terriglobales bacterium]
MIELRSLTKRYGDLLAVDQVSLRVEAGESFAILGPNGSGKTTVLKCIAGLVTPTAGAVLIGGASAGTPAAKRSVSYLPQQVAFPQSLTAREVLEFYCRLRKLPAATAQTALQSSSLNGCSDKPLREFSGGMLQRLGLAVALLPDAPVLLLDEPTAGLDPESALEFRRGLTRLRQQGRTVVFSSHVLSDVEAVADRVAILVRGKLVAVESVVALRERMMLACGLAIALLNPAPELASVACAAGAHSAELTDHTLLVSCNADQRIGVLHALEAAGAIVGSFATREPSLEEIYLRYVNENTTGSDSTDRSADKLSDRAAAAGSH